MAMRLYFSRMRRRSAAVVANRLWFTTELPLTPSAIMLCSRKQALGRDPRGWHRGPRRHPLGSRPSACFREQSIMADGVSGNSVVNHSRFATTAADRLRILEKYKRIAMVGLSSNPFRPSHFAAIYMLSEGYDVIP